MSAQATVIEAPVAGLTPISPVMVDPAPVIADPARIEKFAAPPRSGATAAPIAPGIIAAAISMMTATVSKREELVLPLGRPLFIMKSSLMDIIQAGSGDIPSRILQFLEQLLQYRITVEKRSPDLRLSFYFLQMMYSGMQPEIPCHENPPGMGYGHDIWHCPAILRPYWCRTKKEGPGLA
jgi:hypothetical protein